MGNQRVAVLFPEQCNTVSKVPQVCHRPSRTTIQETFPFRGDHPGLWEPASYTSHSQLRLAWLSALEPNHATETGRWKEGSLTFSTSCHADAPRACSDLVIESSSASSILKLHRHPVKDVRTRATSALRLKERSLGMIGKQRSSKVLH